MAKNYAIGRISGSDPNKEFSVRIALNKTDREVRQLIWDDIAGLIMPVTIKDWEHDYGVEEGREMKQRVEAFKAAFLADNADAYALFNDPDNIPRRHEKMMSMHDLAVVEPFSSYYFHYYIIEMETRGDGCLEVVISDH